MVDPDIEEVARFLNAFDAEAAVSALEAAGIDAIVQRDDAGHLQPELWMSGVAVLVRPPDASRAREILAGDLDPTKRRASSGNWGPQSAPRARWPMVLAVVSAAVPIAVAAVWIAHQSLPLIPRWAPSVVTVVVPAVIPIVVIVAGVRRLLQRRSAARPRIIGLPR